MTWLMESFSAKSAAMTSMETTALVLALNDVLGLPSSEPLHTFPYPQDNGPRCSKRLDHYIPSPRMKSSGGTEGRFTVSQELHERLSDFQNKC